MIDPAMLQMKLLRVLPVQSPHTATDSCFGLLDQQMAMILHQTVSRTPPTPDFISRLFTVAWNSFSVPPGLSHITFTSVSSRRLSATRDDAQDASAFTGRDRSCNQNDR